MSDTRRSAMRGTPGRRAGHRGPRQFRHQLGEFRQLLDRKRRKHRDRTEEAPHA